MKDGCCRSVSGNHQKLSFLRSGHDPRCWKVVRSTRCFKFSGDRGTESSVQAPRRRTSTNTDLPKHGIMIMRWTAIEHFPDGQDLQSDFTSARSTSSDDRNEDPSTQTKSLDQSVKPTKKTNTHKQQWICASCLLSGVLTLCSLLLVRAEQSFDGRTDVNESPKQRHKSKAIEVQEKRFN